MAQTVCVLLSTSDRSRLEAIASDRNQPRKYIERALAVLASVERRPVRRVATEVAVSRPMVWRWQQRFAEEGPDGLLRDKTRKPGKPPILAGTVARVVALTCGDPPAGVTHWTGRAMAKVAGISLRSVQRIWDAHQLQPHRVRSFKRSRDPRFAEKMADVVGLYLDPPAHAVVLSIDEKSQIQALDRTQPGLPLKPLPHAPAHTARQLPFHRQPASRNQLLSQRAQRTAKALHLDRVRRLHLRQACKTACSVRMSQSTSSSRSSNPGYHWARRSRSLELSSPSGWPEDAWPPPIG